MSASRVGLIEVLRIHAVQEAQAGTELLDPRIDEKVVVVRHQRVGGKTPAAMIRDALQASNEVEAVLVDEEDVAAIHTTVRDVVDRRRRQVRTRSARQSRQRTSG